LWHHWHPCRARPRAGLSDRVRLGHAYILTPTVGAPPFRLDEPLPQTIGGRPVARYYDVFLATYAFSVIGLPAMSVPCGFTAAGLPVGLQIVSRRLREDRVLEAAAAYAEARPEHAKPRALSLTAPNPLANELVTPGKGLEQAELLPERTSDLERSIKQREWRGWAQSGRKRTVCFWVAFRQSGR
jgi:hypothetical protein